MNARLTRFMKDLTPPLLFRVLRRLKGQVITFTGDYPSWDAALADASGYDSDEILTRVANATRKVVAGEAVYERDSVTFDRVEYSWPLLASLLQVALERGSLRVVDFGGSLGSTWRQNAAFLRRLNVPLSWCVVEQDNFAALGQAEFGAEVLRFSSSIQTAGESGVDVVLFCGSLSYVPDPLAVMDQAVAAGAPYAIIDRLPVAAAVRDRIMVQHVREPIYRASYPIRVFAEQRLDEQLLRDWRIIEQWVCDLQPDPGSQLRGFFLERR